jgi:hypothetical protein
VSASAKLKLLLAGLALFNLAVFVAKHELEHVLAPVVKALGG